MSPEEERPPTGGAPPSGPPPGGDGRARVVPSRTLAWLRQFAKLWGFALFCIFVVYLFREVALPFLFAILVAYILAPVVDRMAKWRVAGRPFPRALAVILLYVNILAALGLFIGYFIPKLSGDFARLFREAPQLFTRLNKEALPRAGAWVDAHLGAQQEGDQIASDAGEPTAPHTPRELPHGIVLEPLPDGRYRIDLRSLALEVQPAPGGKFIVAAPHSEEAEVVTGGKWERAIKKWLTERVKSTEGESHRAIEYGQKFVTALVYGIGRMFLVLMVAAFILVDLQRVKGFLRSLVPEAYQVDYDRIIAGVDRGLSGVIRGQLVICMINGAMTYIGLLIFHVKYPLLLAGIAATMSLVPIFGSILSSVPIVAIALISSGTFDLKQGLFVLGWIIGIHLVEANFLNPKIMGDAAKIHPVLVVFALIAGEHSYGLVGALFAVPVASIIQTIFSYYRRRRFARAAAPTAM
ncbi:MAG TPA: AI-2E family transporter [Polyangia bacterium]|nr:AI-2E family transporter [Polyangia bacterium]